MANDKQKLEPTWTCPDVRQNPSSIGIGNGTDGGTYKKWSTHVKGMRKNIGSSFEEFLADDGILEQCRATAIKP